MSAVAAVEASLGHLPVLLTVEEAGGVLRIGRTLAYELAGRYEASDGTEGLPVVRIGGCLRVPTWALAELISTGRVVCLVPRPVDTPIVSFPSGEPESTATSTGSEPQRHSTLEHAQHESRPASPQRAADAIQLSLVPDDGD
jgi:hypothetical protein